MFTSKSRPVFQEPPKSPVGMQISFGSLMPLEQQHSREPLHCPSFSSSFSEANAKESTSPRQLSPMSLSSSPPSSSCKSAKQNEPSPSTKLKFGMERLLTQDTDETEDTCRSKRTSSPWEIPLRSGPLFMGSNQPFSMTDPSPFIQALPPNAITPLLPPTRLSSRGASPPYGCDNTTSSSGGCSSQTTCLFNPFFGRISNPFLPLNSLLRGENFDARSLLCPHPSTLSPLNQSLSSRPATHCTELGSGHSKESGSRRKRSWTRAVFSNLQRKGLEKRFLLQKYITKPDRRQLAATLGLTDAQVKVWFQNRRMKWRHAELRKLKGKDETTSLRTASPHQDKEPQEQSAVSSTEHCLCVSDLDHYPVSFASAKSPNAASDSEEEEEGETDREMSPPPPHPPSTNHFRQTL